MEVKIAIWADDPKTMLGLASWLQNWVWQDQEGAVPQVLHWTTPAQVHSALSEKGDIRYVVLFETAQYAIAQAVNTLPSERLARWVTAATKILPLYRRNRRKLLLVSPYLMTSSFDQAQTLLMEYLGISAPLSVGASINFPTLSQWSQSLAMQTVAQNPVARRLVDELEAAMLPFSVTKADSDSAYVEILGKNTMLDELHLSSKKLIETHIEQTEFQTKKTHKLEGELSKITLELDDLQVLYQQTKNDADFAGAEYLAKAENIAKTEDIAKAGKDLLTAQTKGLHAELNTYFVMASTLQKKLATKHIEVQAQQKALEAAHAEVQILTKSVNEMRSHLHHSEDEIDALRSSTSWKITGPIRRIKRTLNRPKEQDDG